MEDRPLGPPPALERAVTLLIPPVARESVAGDLWEIYRGPWSYLGDALPVVFHVVLSQIRRSANPPLLFLRAVLLVFLCSGLVPLPDALGLSAVMMVLGLVIGAYQKGGRDSARRAMIEAVLLAGGAAELSGLIAAHLVQPDFRIAPYFTFLGPYLIPLLCLMRTGILRWSDRAVLPADISSCQALRQRYAQLRRRSVRRNGVEVAALAVAALALPKFGYAEPIYLCGALYLLIAGAAPLCPEGLSFEGLRGFYQRQLTREHATRCLLWWLWLTPVLISLRAEFAAGRPHLSQPVCMALALVLGYFIESLNRERHGRVQEEITRLAVAEGGA